MRAARIESYDDTPKVAETDEPEAGAPRGTVIAAGLNPVDILITSGTFYALRPKPPFTPGLEGVAKRDDGSLVYFGRTADRQHGSLAEFVPLDPEETFELPEGTSPEHALTAGIAGLAGWLSVNDRANVQKGEKVVVTGATGIAGRIALHAARLAGASQIVAVGRNDEDLAKLKAEGFDTMRFHGPMYIHEVELKKLTGGHDVVIDFTWGPPAMAALNSLAKYGRLVQAGNAAAHGSGISASVLRGGEYSILGYSNFNVPAERRRSAHAELLGHLASGEIKVPVETYALDQVGEAWDRQRAGAKAKLVVTI